MDVQQQALSAFQKAIETDMAMTLATADGSGRVTMRLISPVPYGEKILVFTADSSLKYRQLRENPHCCISAGGFFAEAKAEFCGAAALPENAALRAAYVKKFADAFDKKTGYDPNKVDFLLLTPTRLTGWVGADGASVPNIPVEIPLP